MQNSFGATQPETPPRAWGRHVKITETEALYGNTPTGVGKTRYGSTKFVQMAKHPHGRGEDVRFAVI